MKIFVRLFLNKFLNALFFLKQCYKNIALLNSFNNKNRRNIVKIFLTFTSRHDHKILLTLIWV